MATSKKQTEAIREWFLAPPPNGFWAEYPSDLCGGTRKKGSRGEALKAMLKLNPDEAERERILGNLKAQVRHDTMAKRSGEEIYRWPYCTTYINGYRFDDVIDSVADVKVKCDVGVCSHGDCGEECMGDSYKYCSTHIPEPPWLIKARKEGLAKAGLVWVRDEETFHEFSVRCKHYCLETHGVMLRKAQNG